MKYYVLQVTRLTGQNDAVAVTVKTNEEEARMLFQQILAAAYATANIEMLMAQITNEYGNVIAVETWHKSESEA